MRTSLRTARPLVWLHRVELGVTVAALLLLAGIPIVEILLRRLLRTGIPAANDYMQHLVLCIGFLGAALASRFDKHLSLRVGAESLPSRYRVSATVVASLAGTTVCLILAWSSVRFIALAFEPSARVGVVPMRVALSVIPLGYALMGVRFVGSAPAGWWGKGVAAGGAPLALLAGLFFPSAAAVLSWPVILLLLCAGLFGAPIFVVLGGIAAVLFVGSGGTTVVLPNESYVMLTRDMLPTLPLFTLTGFLLSQGKAGERLVRLFRGWFGWLPGGMAVVAIVICTFFTALTGASGVTILALGGLLSYVLLQGNYDKDFTTGLLTVNGIGSLFPPSLPIIMFGVLAQVSVRKMFAAVLVPCAIMVSFLIAYSVFVAVKKKIARTPFDRSEAFASLWPALGEILLPVVILGTFFGGLTTLVETAALSVLYVLVLELCVHRELTRSMLWAAFSKSVPIMGGVLVILATARGVSYYLVDAQIPMHLTAWLGQYVESKYLFLFLLNLFLLAAGCIMDVYSALIVLVPLLLPLARSYGIDPVHLGVLFLANLEVGFLTPPVGINLFFASYRFNVPLTRVYRTVIPFLIVMLLSVLLITYFPALTTIPAGWVD